MIVISTPSGCVMPQRSGVSVRVPERHYPPETAVEQQLHEQTAVLMPDQHRWLIEVANQPLVVVDDLPRHEAGRRLGGLTHPLNNRAPRALAPPGDAELREPATGIDVARTIERS